MAVTKNIEIFKGEDWTYVLSPATGVTPTDITGYTISFTVKQNYTDTAAVISKTVGSGIVLTTPGTGIFTITINSADTASLEPRHYYYDIQRTNSGGVTVLTEGRLTLKPEVRI